MILRSLLAQAVRDQLRAGPVVALIGARQVGKTTLARLMAGESREPVHVFDLEDPDDLARLSRPMDTVRDLTGLVVIDEIHRRPDLFPVLRVLADRRPLPARFLVLGSASIDLSRQRSESLAGRIALVDLGGLSIGRGRRRPSHQVVDARRIPTLVHREFGRAEPRVEAELRAHVL